MTAELETLEMKSKGIAKWTRPAALLDAAAVAGTHTTIHESVDDCPGGDLEKLQLRLGQSGVTRADVSRHLGVDCSTVSHQLTGRERLQQRTRDAIVSLSRQRLASLRQARSFERRLVQEVDGLVQPVIDYSEADCHTPLFEFSPEFDGSEWLYLRKCIGLLAKGKVYVAAEADSHLTTGAGDDLMVYITKLRRDHGYYGFHRVRRPRWSVFVCRRSNCYDLENAQVYLLPPYVVAEYLGISGDVLIPRNGLSLPRPSRWPGRDLRSYRVNIADLRSLGDSRLAAKRTDGPGGDEVADDGWADHWFGEQGPRWTTAEEARLRLLWRSPDVSLFALTRSFPDRGLLPVLQHGKKMGLPIPPWWPRGRQRWTPEEDEALALLADGSAIDDAVMSLAFPNRSPHSVRGRLQRLMRARPRCNTSGGAGDRVRCPTCRGSGPAV